MGVRAVLQGVSAVHPGELVSARLTADRESISIDGVQYTRAAIDEVVVVGAGKASALMAAVVVEELGRAQWPCKGCVNVPSEQRVTLGLQLSDDDCLELGPACVGLTFASHPIPDAKGVQGAQEQEALLRDAGPRTLVLALISGGGSALLPSPSPPLTLEQLQITTRLLLASGARIDEVNTVRKHLETLKGGQMARLAARSHVAAVVSWVLSDVVGDDLATIASGPTVPDDTTFFQAVSLMQRRGVDTKVPSPVWWHLTRGLQGKMDDTPRIEDAGVFGRCSTTLIGSAATAAESVRGFLERDGWRTRIWTSRISGEARHFGASLLTLIDSLLKEEMEKKSDATPNRIAFIGTGELTVTLGDGTPGKGGRNQEALLALLCALHDAREKAGGGGRVDPMLPSWCESGHWSWVVVAAAYDGLEGNSSAMGAVVGPWSVSETRASYLSGALRDALNAHNSHSVFGSSVQGGLGDALMTGATGTNVNDMVLVLLERCM